MRLIGYFRGDVNAATEASSLQSAARRYGVTLLSIIDDSNSPRSLESPGLQRAIREIKGGGADGLIVTQLNRFSHGYSIVEMAQAFTKNGLHMTVDAPDGNDTTLYILTK